MLSDEELCPDFDIGISGGGVQDVWHSDSDGEQSDSPLEENQEVPDEDSQESDETKQMRQLRKILKVPDHRPDDSESTVERVSRRQRPSRSRSKASDKYEGEKNEVPESNFISVPLKYLTYSVEKSLRITYVGSLR